MKNSIILSLVLGIIMLIMPISALKGQKVETGAFTSVQNILSQDAPEPEAYKSFNIKSEESGKIEKIGTEEYIIGVVSAEMPALYEPEALKAQAVAAYTFACYKKANSDTDYDLTDQSKTDQSYISDKASREKWGENYEEYHKKISDAVKSVSGMMLTYNNATALTVYHAISSGVTESCAEVWGSEIPYLVSVDSVGDKTAENYLFTASLTADEVSSALSGLKTADGDPSAWFGEAVKSDTGRVKSVSFCGTEISGAELADALGLRSSNFDIARTESGFDFTTRGYGHGVGMSQNGAQYMAKQGSSFEEILAHYYPCCTLVKAKN